MNIIDNRKTDFKESDIVIFDNGKKYLVIYETGGIAWHFLDLETFKFDADLDVDISSNLKIGTSIESLGVIVSVIPSEEITLTLGRY